MAKLQELTGIFATVNACSAVFATTEMPLLMLRQSRSTLVSQHIDCGDEPVASPLDVDDEPIPALAVTQRATQSSHLSREVGGGDKMIRPNASSQVLLADKLASPFNQSNQDLQSTASERHGLVALQQRNCVGSRQNGPNKTSVGAAASGPVRFSTDVLAVSRL